MIEEAAADMVAWNLLLVAIMKEILNQANHHMAILMPTSFIRGISITPGIIVSTLWSPAGYDETLDAGIYSGFNYNKIKWRGK